MDVSISSSKGAEMGYLYRRERGKKASLQWFKNDYIMCIIKISHLIHVTCTISKSGFDVVLKVN